MMPHRSVAEIVRDVEARLSLLRDRDPRGFVWCLGMVARAASEVMTTRDGPMHAHIRMALLWGIGSVVPSAHLFGAATHARLRWENAHAGMIARIMRGAGRDRAGLHLDAVGLVVKAIHQMMLCAADAAGVGDGVEPSVLGCCHAAGEALALQAAAAEDSTHPHESGPEYRRAKHRAWESMRLFISRQAPVQFDLARTGGRPRSADSVWLTQRLLRETRGWPGVAWDGLAVMERPARDGELGDALARWHQLGFRASDWLAQPLARAVVERCTVDELQPFVRGDR